MKPKTKSTVGPICPYCEYHHVEETAWGAGDYTQTCRGCGKKFDLTIRVTRTYLGSAPDEKQANE